jgi:transcriptional regulator with XRE-family HTH domain
MAKVKYVEYSPDALTELRGKLPRSHVSFMSKVPASTIEKLERGEREPGIAVLRKLGEYYGVKFY